MYRYLHTVYPDSRWYGRHCLSHHSHRIQVAAYFRALDMDLNHAWKPLSEQMIGETVKQRRISVSRYFQLQEDGRAIVGQARWDIATHTVYWWSHRHRYQSSLTEGSKKVRPEQSNWTVTCCPKSSMPGVYLKKGEQSDKYHGEGTLFQLFCFFVGWLFLGCGGVESMIQGFLRSWILNLGCTGLQREADQHAEGKAWPWQVISN